MEMTFLIVMFFFPDFVFILIGTVHSNHIDVEFKGIIMLMIITIILITVVTGDWAAWKSIKSKKHIVKLKGKV